MGHKYELESKGRRLVSRSTPWGLRESFLVEDGRRLEHKITSHSALHREISYAYNPNGDLINLSDSEIGERRYSYDGAERLAGVHYQDKRVDDYEYDPAGNIVSLPERGIFRIGTGNRLENWSEGSEQYNDRGNLIQRRTPAGRTRFYYNSYDLLERVELPDGRGVHYRYDDLRRRISKELDGQKTEYLWDDDRLVAERIRDQWTRIYVYAYPDDWVPVSFVDYHREGEEWKGAAYCIHTNHLHTPIAVTDETGKAVWSVDLTPYGAVREYIIAEIEFNLRLPGQYFDAETGLHYNRHRYYDPEIGRYIQPDPMGLAGGINLYAYPQNPLSNFDFLGLTHRRDSNRTNGDDGDAPDPRARRTPPPPNPDTVDR